MSVANGSEGAAVASVRVREAVANLSCRAITKLFAIAANEAEGWIGNLSDEDVSELKGAGLIFFRDWDGAEHWDLTGEGDAFVRAYGIDHDIAHAMADVAALAGQTDLALEILRRATRNGRLGVGSSIRTANRICNMRTRLEEVSHA